MSRLVRSFDLFILCLLLAACGHSGRTPVTPSPLSAGTLTPGATQPSPQGAVFTVSGVVTEIAGGHSVALQDVHVEDSYRHAWVKTGNNGSYAISGVSAGHGYIVFMKDGYKSYVQEFTLTSDSRLDVVLVKIE